jgi:hypothetical protein
MLQLFGEFYRTLGGQLSKQGFENPHKTQPNPLQKQAKPTQQSVSGLVPFVNQK